jgi:hypothetical protein
MNVDLVILLLISKLRDIKPKEKSETRAGFSLSHLN